MSTGEASALLVVAVVALAIGLFFLLNVRDLPARLYQRSADFWAGRRIFYLDYRKVLPFWLYRYVLGIWFCAMSILAAVSAARSF